MRVRIKHAAMANIARRPLRRIRSSLSGWRRGTFSSPQISSRSLRFSGGSFHERSGSAASASVRRPWSALAAAEDEQFRAFCAEAFEFGGFEGGGLAENPGDDARFDRLVADGVEWGVVHFRIEIRDLRFISPRLIPRRGGGGNRLDFSGRGGACSRRCRR